MQISLSALSYNPVRLEGKPISALLSPIKFINFFLALDMVWNHLLAGGPGGYLSDQFARGDLLMGTFESGELLL